MVDFKKVYKLKESVFNAEVTLKAGTEVIRVSSSTEEWLGCVHIVDRNFTLMLQVGKYRLEECPNWIQDWEYCGIDRKRVDTSGTL